jgi:hypothetical protein
MAEIKPLNWTPAPGIGYSVVRRPDGGMNLTFTDLSDATVRHWYEFSSEHLLGSDRLTRNLYDLRQVAEIPEKAVRTAIELNSDPAARNIRLAVLVASQGAADAIRRIAAGVLPETAVTMKVFISLDEAEAWLSRPLDRIA